MNLFQAASLAEELKQKHMKDLGAYWHITFNPRLRRILGRCTHQFKLIELNTQYVKLNTLEEVTDTILHEIAHALVGPEHGHDAVWEAKAISVGATPRRCGSSDAVVVPAAYEAKCPCGKTFKKYRRPWTVRICRRCRAILEFKKVR